LKSANLDEDIVTEKPLQSEILFSSAEHIIIINTHRSSLYHHFSSSDLVKDIYWLSLIAGAVN